MTMIIFRHASRTAIAAIAALGAATPAHAHLVGARFGDFYAGALHPVTDLNDIVLWIALGVLAGSLGVRRGRWLVLLFPLGLAVGFFLSTTLGISFDGDTTNATVIGVLGLLLAAGLPIPAAALGCAGFALAVMRGIANAAAVGPATNLPLFAAGLACAGYATMALVMASVVAFRRADGGQPTAWRGIALRAIGGWIAAIGLMMIGFTLAGSGGA